MLEIVMSKLLANVPFFMTSVSGGKMNYTRIIESIIIVTLTTAATGYVTIKLLEQKSVIIESRVDRIEKKMDDFIKDFYEPRRR